MHTKITRRDVMKGGLASVGLATLGLPLGVMPALAQDETVVPFLDFPANFNANPRAGSRFLDTRTVNNFITPADQFYTFQHFGQPQIDKATFKLKMTGMFTTPREFTLQEIQSMKPLEQIVAYECGGNGPRNNAQGMVSNGRWKGTSLASFLKRCGVSSEAKEVVFYGADFQAEDVTHGRGTQHIDKNYFARSLSLEHAMKPEVMLAFEALG
jgi:DMSO/TMAO reductase YedYZ molybdopterin-dependent catalytic subunit